VAAVFWATLTLGGLFFTMLQHVTGAVWSVVVRRGSEALAMVIPVVALLFVPLLFGLHSLYHWTDTNAVAHDAVLTSKAPYLNTTFFIIRLAVYFVIWTWLAWMLNKHSFAQDDDRDPMHSYSLRKISAGGMFLFAFSITFFAFDWLMSLTPHWYSTIFGVYVFVGGFLVSLAFLTLFYQSLAKRGALDGLVTLDHFHDFGRLLFAFTVFWAYIGASQYFLIWYANIPEETVWFLARWEASWKPYSITLIMFHFAVPFIVLAFYAAKRNTAVLRAIAVVLFVMHYFDMYWVVMPTFTPAGFTPSWIDLTAWIGVGGIVLWRFLSRFQSRAIIPAYDPHLADSMAHNV
jgi:hypothetical protein